MGYDYVFDISYSQAGPSFYRIIVARLKSNYVTTGSITGSQVLQSYDVTNNSFNNFNSPPNILLAKHKIYYNQKVIFGKSSKIRKLCLEVVLLQVQVMH